MGDTFPSQRSHEEGSKLREHQMLNIVVSILMLHKYESSEEAFRLVWDAIPTIFPVNNPPHPVIAKRKAPTYRVDI